MNARMNVPGLSHWCAAVCLHAEFDALLDAEFDALLDLILCSLPFSAPACVRVAVSLGFGRGVSKADAAPTSDLVDKSQISSSMQGNPIKVRSLHLR